MNQPQTTRSPRTNWLALFFVMAISWSQAGESQAAGKAESLLQLVPPDSSVTVALEGGIEQWNAISASPLYRAVKGIPSIRRWLDSDDVGKARSTIATMETALGVKFDDVVKSLLGEAAVLSLRVPAEEGPAAPQGLLLLKFSDRPLLDGLIARLNTAQREAGELLGIRELRHEGMTYWVRTFKAGAKPPEWYATLGENRFAWSNSEETIRKVIERQTRGNGLAAEARFKTIREQLPANSLLSVFVDPRPVETLLNSAPPPSKAQEARFLAYLTGYLGALKFTGAAMTWNNGPALHIEELIDPEKLAPEFKSWAQLKPREKDGPRRPVPITAFALADATLDLGSILTLFEQITRDESPERTNNLWIGLDGIFLGMRARTEVLPRLGPGVIAYLELPDMPTDGAWRWPGVLEITLPGDDQGKLGEAVVNGLRTLLAFSSLDEKRREEHLGVETKSIDGTLITFLAPVARIAFAARSDRLVIGSSPEAVARAFATDKHSVSRFDRIREKLPTQGGSSVFVDLRTLHAFAERERSGLAREFARRGHRSEAEVARDLGQLLELVAPFEAAYLTSRIEAGFTGVHRSLGLLGASDSAR